MKKKYIQLGVAALVLAALAGALVLLRAQPEVVTETETPATEIIYIYGDAETESTTPKQIDIHNEFGDITIDNITAADAPSTASAELTIRGLEDLSLDTYGLGQAASNAKAMRAKDIISENAAAEELKTFGLDSPRASIEVHLQNGDKPVLLFGADAPGGEGVYVKTEKANAIYLISDTMAAPYFKPATAYVDKTITAADPEFKGFEKITLSGTNYPETLVIERTPETEVFASGVTMNTHSFTQPIRRGIDSQRGLDLFASVYGLLANDVVAVDDSPETLAKYGLSDPATVISVEGDTPEMTFTLRISEPADNGEVRLIKDGSKVIYELSPSALLFLDKTMFDMMERMVILPNIKTISKVVFKTAEQSYEFVVTQEDEGKKLDVTANGVPLPDVVDESGKSVTGGENFRKLYQTMLACRYDEEMPKAETVEDLSAGEPGVTESTNADDGEPGVTESTNADDGEPGVTDASDEGSMFKSLEAEEISNTEPQTAVNASDAAFLASIEYIYIDGKASDIVSFYEGPPRKVDVRLNGEIGYYTQSIYYDRLIEDVEKVINGIAVKTYL